MSTTRFLFLVRQYAALARKRSSSYATMVDGLVELYVAGSPRQPLTKEAAAERLRWAMEVVEREYKPHDPLPPLRRQMPLF